MNDHNRALLDLTLACHPSPDRYCHECHMRKENCKCRKQPALRANQGDWALVPDGAAAKKPLRNVWSVKQSCRELQNHEEILHGDRVWCVVIQLPRSDLKEMGGINSGHYLAWKERAFRTTPPMWHPVSPDMIGKRPKDLITASPIGRPREDWEYISDTTKP